MNAIRTRTLIRECDIMVVRFSPPGDKGAKYRQWNAAFDAGFAAALGKPIITLHDLADQHPLKEVNGATLEFFQTVEQLG